MKKWKNNLLFHTIFFPLLFLLFFPRGIHQEIKSLSISNDVIIPDKNEEVTFSFITTKSLAVDILVVDSEHCVVRRISKNERLKKGKHEIKWDGKDEAGNILPDGVYFFVIMKSGGKIIFNPLKDSGGIKGEVRDLKVDRGKKILEFNLNQKSRVQVKVQIVQGPVLKILSDWEPLPAGWNQIKWDGFDEDKIVDITKFNNYKFSVQYLTLPDSAVILRSNVKKQANFKEVLNLNPVQDDKSSVLFSQLHYLPLSQCKSYPVTLVFPEKSEEEIPTFSDNIKINVDIPNKNYPISIVEIYFYLDLVILTEKENIWGLPYECTLVIPETIKDGEHIFTVNVDSINQQVGIKSKKIIIRRNKECN